MDFREGIRKNLVPSVLRLSRRLWAASQAAVGREDRNACTDAALRTGTIRLQYRRDAPGMSWT